MASAEGDLGSLLTCPAFMIHLLSLRHTKSIFCIHDCPLPSLPSPLLENKDKQGMYLIPRHREGIPRGSGP